MHEVLLLVGIEHSKLLAEAQLGVVRPQQSQAQLMKVALHTAQVSNTRPKDGRVTTSIPAARRQPICFSTRERISSDAFRVNCAHKHIEARAIKNWLTVMANI